MAWQVEIVRIVRFLIDDIDSSSYDNDRLEETVLVAAQLMKSDTTFDYDYTVDVDSLILDPDPTTMEDKDDVYINLLALKAACLILRAEVRVESLKAISIKDGPSSIDLKGRFEATKMRAEQMCEDYEKAKRQFKIGNARGVQAIVSSYVIDNLPATRGNF